jgi:RNA-directed DNA polymerase
MQTPANVTERRTDWNSVDWQKTNRIVGNLRRRLFRATTQGDLKKVRSLQRLMLRSHANALVSVRRVTQQNRGKNTPGIDKVTILTPKARGRTVDTLLTDTAWQAKPVRRVHIPKANGKTRPLGIPVVRDRCLQALVKNALEPCWEAQFEGSSYGFRPGRSCHDAIAKVYLLARPNKRKKWVVDADINGAFDTIDHAHLLQTIGNFPARRLIRDWLNAGVLEEGVFHETERGTPQGGVISPLLANIALHGMEDALGVKHDQRGEIRGPRAVVRYADDFVVFCQTKEDAEQAVALLQEWLKERGLTLSEEKTKIVHLTEGFDFLGFNIRHYPVSSTKTGYKLLIKPSRKSEQAIREKLKKEWLRCQGSNVAAVLKRLNPIIRGWANYFRIGVSSKTFRKLDTWMYVREKRYGRQTHPRKSRNWITARYWGRLNKERNDHWVFGEKKTGAYLRKFSWHAIQRHVLVQGNASPDDPALKQYWEKRQQAKGRDLLPSDQKIARWQEGKCPVCKETLFNGEELHRDHILSRKEGGKDEYRNLQLVHFYCHQQKHAQERVGSE